MFYVHIYTGRHPRSYVIRPYKIQKLIDVHGFHDYVHIETATVTCCSSLMKLVDIRGRMLYAHIEAGGGPPMSFFMSI